MIGRISGKLLEKAPNRILVDVSGVGYEVEVPFSTAYELGEAGAAVSLHTHFVVREDAQLLFGFASRSERDLFRQLIRVNGVGPKLALAILSTLETDQFVAVVERNDVTAMTKVPGVGKKTAERLIIEMRDRLKELGDAASTALSEGVAQTSRKASFSAVDEAESALLALGYKPTDVSKMLQGLKSEDLSTEEIVRTALKSMVNA